MNTRIVTIALLGLVVVLFACVVIIGALAYADRTIPDVLQNIAVGSLTGLVGILVPARSSSTSS